MPVNPELSLQVKPLEIPSQVDSYAKALTLRGLVNQGALQNMQIQDAQRKQQERMTLRDVLQRSGGDMNAVVPELMKAGLPEQALAFQKQVREQQKSGLEIQNLTSQINDRNWKTEKDRTQTFMQAASGPLMKYKELVASGMPDQVARQTVQPLYEQSFVGAFQSGLFDQKHMQGIPAQFDPQWAESALSQTMTYDKVLADWRANRTFQETQQHNRTTEGLTQRGQNITLRGQNMVDARTREEGAANRSVTMRGQTQVVETPSGFSLIDKGSGQARPVISATGEQEQQPDSPKYQAKKLHSQLMEGIRMARELIPKATASGAGSLVDSSIGFFGKSTPGADAASQLDTLAGWMTSNVPRMQGPQSDKDTLLYKQMAATVGDRTKPASQRLEALNTLEDLQNKYSAIAGNSPSSSMPAGVRGIKFLGFE